MLRRRLGCFLLVLYVAALHGLPALHLATHRNDHVHELGGLRWIRPLPGHTHSAGLQHEADDSEVELRARAPRQHLRAATDASATAATQHLALGPAHGHAALLTPPVLLSLAPSAQCHALVLSCIAPAAGEPAAHHRARAPPLPV